MSGFRPPRYKPLPKPFEGEQKEEVVRKMYGRNQVDRKFLVAALEEYHARVVRPMAQRIVFLELPFWKRWWYHLSRAGDWARDRVHRAKRAVYAWRWRRAEKRGDHAGPEEGDDG